MHHGVIEFFIVMQQGLMTQPLKQLSTILGLKNGVQGVVGF